MDTSFPKEEWNGHIQPAKSLYDRYTAVCRVLLYSLWPSNSSICLRKVGEDAKESNKNNLWLAGKLLDNGREWNSRDTCSTQRKHAINFALKNKDTTRFGHWFPIAPQNRLVRTTTHRRYQEKLAKTERTRSNPIQNMIRLLNKMDQRQWAKGKEEYIAEDYCEEKQSRLSTKAFT